jgi:plasmid stabilization system protein ParE
VKVRYTRRALRQLAEILGYIDAHSPQGADNVKRRLQSVVDLRADRHSDVDFFLAAAIAMVIGKP